MQISLEKYKLQTNVLPTMKPLNDVNKVNDVKNQPVEEMKAEPEKIDFSSPTMYFTNP